MVIQGKSTVQSDFFLFWEKYYFLMYIGWSFLGFIVKYELLIKWQRIVRILNEMKLQEYIDLEE